MPKDSERRHAATWMPSPFDTTNQAAILALFRVMSRYFGNLPSMPGTAFVKLM